MIFARAVVYFSTNRSGSKGSLECHVHLETIISLNELFCMSKLLSWACCKIIMRNRGVRVLLNFLGKTRVHCNLLTLVVLVLNHWSVPNSSLWLLSESKHSFLIICIFIKSLDSSLWSCPIIKLAVSIGVRGHRPLDRQSQPLILEGIFNILNRFKSCRWVLIVNVNRLIGRCIRWNFIIYVNLWHILWKPQHIHCSGSILLKWRPTLILINLSKVACSLRPTVSSSLIQLLWTLLSKQLMKSNRVRKYRILLALQNALIFFVRN